ncbi:MAG: glycosyltransferase family 4 protein [Acidobacteria bacterium]|nr:glycosyltransferase family 4 protein [Acidobacteriota bacterium]
MEKIPVLHLDAGREMRGGQWQALYLMVGQKTIGLEPRLLAPSDSPLFREATQRGIPTRSLSLWAIRAESKQCRITHAHDARSHTWAVLAARGKVVVSRRVAFPVKQGWFSRWKYSKAHLYLAVSEYVARELINAGIEAARVRVVPDGVPVETAVKQAGSQLVAPLWHDPAKGDALARAAGQLAGCNITFSENLAADLPNARAMLYLTKLEGLGSGALLAMSHGVPVIASRAGGLPEIVRDGVNGLLVENQPESVAAAIRQLMDNPPLAARMGEAGRQIVLEGYTLAHLALRTYHEYKLVLA